jgi:histidyl-tRNA synthetase
MSLPKLSAVKGMNDILPSESALWEHFEATVRRVMSAYGYQNMRAPVVEPTALFVRGIGEVTDIVEKEMYSFEDKLNGERLTLRPEFTAGLVRAVNEHNLLYEGPKRVWCTGPVFRHEKPQRGRYRQFYQVDVEAFGMASPDVDAEVIVMAARLLKELGLRNIELQINSIGQPEERKAHREALIAHFEKHRSVLDEEAKRRLHTNPLRLLDSKHPPMQEMLNTAPNIQEYASVNSCNHYDSVKSILTSLGFSYTENPRLVRGLDYYNLTVFEFVTTELGSQGTVCGGGRYDYLIEQLGGKPAPGIGWGLGIERILDLMKTQGLVTAAHAMDIYIVVQSESLRNAALKLAEELRDAGHSVLLHAGAASMKNQFKKADASGAKIALVVAEQEWANAQIVVKYLRQDEARGANQEVVAIAELKAHLLHSLK